MSQAQPCIEYNPACVECRRDAGKDAAGTTWQCIGHAYLERDRLRTAQAERDAALQRAETAEKVRVLYCAYCNTGTRVAEHASREDAVKAMVAHDVVCRQNPLVQRAEQLQRDIEMRDMLAEQDAGKLTYMAMRAEQAEAALAQAQASIAEIEDIVINGDDPAALREAIDRSRLPAQPPALPPLPEGWVRESDECAENLGFVASWRGPLCHRVYLWPSGQTRIDANLPPADLITVLRHAEAAHLKLKGGAK